MPADRKNKKKTPRFFLVWEFRRHAGYGYRWGGDFDGDTETNSIVGIYPTLSEANALVEELKGEASSEDDNEDPQPGDEDLVKYTIQETTYGEVEC
jgi:hypothetical protein